MSVTNQLMKHPTKYYVYLGFWIVINNIIYIYSFIALIFLESQESNQSNVLGPQWVLVSVCLHGH